MSKCTLVDVGGSTTTVDADYRQQLEKLTGEWVRARHKPERQPYHIDVDVYDENGEQITRLSVTINPEAPACISSKGHDWWPPHEVFRGFEENTDSYDVNNIHVVACCVRCGCRRTTNAKRRYTGEMWDTEVNYEGGYYADRLQDVSITQPQVPDEQQLRRVMGDDFICHGDDVLNALESLVGSANAMRRAETDPIRSVWWAGYIRGLRRAHRGEQFDSDATHQLWLSAYESDDPSRASISRGYRAGYNYNQLLDAIIAAANAVEGPKVIEILTNSKGEKYVVQETCEGFGIVSTDRSEIESLINCPQWSMPLIPDKALAAAPVQSMLWHIHYGRGTEDAHEAATQLMRLFDGVAARIAKSEELTERMVRMVLGDAPPKTEP